MSFNDQTAIGRSLTIVVLLKVPRSGIRDFLAYEACALPLVAAHGGALQRRLRNGDGTAECHLLSFPNREAFERFKADPRRAAAAHLLATSGATAEVFEMSDVEAAE